MDGNLHAYSADPHHLSNLNRSSRCDSSLLFAVPLLFVNGVITCNMLLASDEYDYSLLKTYQPAQCEKTYKE